MVEWETLEEDSVGKREDGRIRTDAQRQRGHRHGREAGAFRQRAQGEPDVVQQGHIRVYDLGLHRVSTSNYPGGPLHLPKVYPYTLMPDESSFPARAPYSCRSATAGSTRIALRAGM